MKLNDDYILLLNYLLIFCLAQKFNSVLKQDWFEKFIKSENNLNFYGMSLLIFTVISC